LHAGRRHHKLCCSTLFAGFGVLQNFVSPSGHKAQTTEGDGSCTSASNPLPSQTIVVKAIVKK
jgi:hypothetical protein